MKCVPPDYYARLAQIDATHWWPQGMIAVESALLAPWLERGSLALLDGGCGPGGFLLWAGSSGRFASLAGVDLSPEAIQVARSRVPSADLHVAPLDSLPFGESAFDVVALNDVLQHVDETVMAATLNEVRRVLRPDGALLTRTGGGRRVRRERGDWRAYDEATLRADLRRGGFDVRRTTYANLAFSALAEARGRRPHAPTDEGCGVPEQSGTLASAAGRLTLSLEARLVRVGGRLPWGHTLLAVAVPS